MKLLDSIKRQIPNVITLCNLTCGVIATWYAVQSALMAAAFFICLGILFDFFDGLSARALKVSSPLGKELDSLADVVTSGVAPAFILYRVVEYYFLVRGTFSILPFVAFLMPAFSAYRLAKFNLDTRQSHSFLGLPVPCNALIWAAVGVCIERYCMVLSSPVWMWFPKISLIDIAWVENLIWGSVWGMVALVAVSLLTDLAMVSEIPLFALKFKNLSWSDNKLRFIFLVTSALLLLLLGPVGLVLAVFLYIVLSLLTQKKTADE